jgi:amidase
MVQRGAARGKTGKTHYLTEDRQGRYHYVYGPYAELVPHIQPGDVVVAETLDAFEGRLRTEADQPSKLLNFPFLNPQCGPIAVEGAAKGDVLAVRIVSIEPAASSPSAPRRSCRNSAAWSERPTPRCSTSPCRSG